MYINYIYEFRFVFPQPEESFANEADEGDAGMPTPSIVIATMQGRGMVSYFHQGGGEGLVPASLLSPIPLSWFKNEAEEEKEEEEEEGEEEDEEDVVFSTGNETTHQ